MKTAWRMGLMAVCGIAGLVCWPLVQAQEKDAATGAQAPPTRAEREAKELDAARVPLAVARDRARTMHEIYAATLDVMHHRYFHTNRSVVPARAMKDVFSHVKLQSRMQARWIAVNLPAMSLDNEPESEFEKRAARELGADTSAIEVVEEGYYRRASAIPLTGGCIGCHSGFKPNATPKFAGLVISIPIQAESAANTPADSHPAP